MPMTAAEQLMLELINRARLDPVAEAARQQIALNEGLAPGTIGTAAMQPLAASDLLRDAALGHSGWMMETGVFSHVGAGASTPDQRMKAAGYQFTGAWGWTENIAGLTGAEAADAATAILEHFDGLYASARHRSATLGADYREIGIGQQTGTQGGLPASIVTQNYAYSGTGLFLTGVAIRDSDGDRFYDIGEGRGGVVIGTATTAAAGGYALALSGGVQQITVQAGGVTTRFAVQFAGQNVKLDVLLDEGGQAARFLTSGDLTLLGTAGADMALLGHDTGSLTGGGGHDTLTGNTGSDLLRGGAGDDSLAGLGGDDLIHGDDGDDLILGGAGNDTLFGGGGNDTLYGGAGRDLLIGGDGDDLIHADWGTTSAWGGGGHDTLIGGTQNDTLGGGDGNDLLDARAGGRNALWGGAGNDLIHGGAGSDTVTGGADQDTVYGGAGDDVIYLGQGNDVGHGGEGNDTIVAGPGFDRIWGGAGADEFDFWRGAGWNQLEDFSAPEGDTLALSRWLWAPTHGALTAGQVVDTFGSVNAWGDAVLDFGAAGTTVVIVGAGTLDDLAGSIVIL
ncbi:CAP domain-containing protein [Gemmobacter nectariphilus]|uniref:CAP domain-containing protein n=1 Tax=Gemmobacter nectariphilus TaxID=220343 RepID=UPI000422E54D|nr:CAP domain-containing protein [Gemmobacter nectariphilus]